MMDQIVFMTSSVFAFISVSGIILTLIGIALNKIEV